MNREAIDDEVCKILVKDGPDGHVDGHDVITDYICRLLAEEREACAQIAEAAPVQQDYLVGRDLLTVDNGWATKRHIAAAIRARQTAGEGDPATVEEALRRIRKLCALESDGARLIYFQYIVNAAASQP